MMTTTLLLTTLYLFFHSDHPMFLTYVLLSLTALFKSYPCVGNITLPLALLPLWGHTFRCELKYQFYTVEPPN